MLSDRQSDSFTATVLEGSRAWVKQFATSALCGSIIMHQRPKACLRDGSRCVIASKHKDTLVECKALFGKSSWAQSSLEVIALVETLFEYIRLLVAMPRLNEIGDMDLGVNSQLKQGMVLQPSAALHVGDEFAGQWKVFEENQFKQRLGEITDLAQSVVKARAESVFKDLKTGLSCIFAQAPPYRSLNICDPSVVAAAVVWKISDEAYKTWTDFADSTRDVHMKVQLAFIYALQRVVNSLGKLLEWWVAGARKGHSLTHTPLSGTRAMRLYILWPTRHLNYSPHLALSPTLRVRVGPVIFLTVRFFLGQAQLRDRFD